MNSVGVSLECQAHGERVVDIVMRAAVLIWRRRQKGTQMAAVLFRRSRGPSAEPVLLVAEGAQCSGALPGTFYDDCGVEMRTHVADRRPERRAGGPK